MLDKKLEALHQYLPQLSKDGIKHLINGEKVSSANGETFNNTTPTDQSFICEVASGDAAEIDAAAKAATDAFKTWKNVSAAE